MQIFEHDISRHTQQFQAAKNALDAVLTENTRFLRPDATPETLQTLINSLEALDRAIPKALKTHMHALPTSEDAVLLHHVPIEGVQLPGCINLPLLQVSSYACDNLFDGLKSFVMSAGYFAHSSGEPHSLHFDRGRLPAILGLLCISPGKLPMANNLLAMSTALEDPRFCSIVMPGTVPPTMAQKRQLLEYRHRNHIPNLDSYHPVHDTTIFLDQRDALLLPNHNVLHGRLSHEDSEILLGPLPKTDSNRLLLHTITPLPSKEHLLLQIRNEAERALQNSR